MRDKIYFSKYHAHSLTWICRCPWISIGKTYRKSWNSKYFTFKIITLLLRIHCRIHIFLFIEQFDSCRNAADTRNWRKSLRNCWKYSIDSYFFFLYSNTEANFHKPLALHYYSFFVCESYTNTQTENKIEGERMRSEWDQRIEKWSHEFIHSVR